MDDFANSNNAALRRLSMRKSTLDAFEHRRRSYLTAERRRSTLRRQSSLGVNVPKPGGGQANEAFEADSAMSEEYSGSAMSRSTTQFADYLEEESGSGSGKASNHF